MILLLVAVLLVILYFYGTSTYGYWKRLKVVGPAPVPLLGNIKDVALLRKFPGACHQDIYREYSNERFVGIYQLRTPSLLIRDPELIRLIMVKDFDHFMDRGFHVDADREPLTCHLVSLAGTKWRLLRNKLTPAFSSGKIKNMFPILNECSENLSSLIKSKIGNEGVLEMREVSAQFTTDVIGTVAFGLHFDSMAGDSVFREMGQKALQPTVKSATAKALRAFLPWLFDLLQMRTFPEEINSFFIGVVKQTMEHRKETNFHRNDFLQLLMQLKSEDEGKTFEESINAVIAAQAFIFFLAGFETSSTTLSFCLYELSKNPDCQAKALNEIQEVLSKHGSLTYEAVADMVYVEQLLLETMRLYPPVSSLSRVCTKAYTVPGTDVHIDEGVAVVIPIYAIQHDPAHYPEPEKFKPERFSSKDILKSHIYLPFGEGPRVCIGMRFAMLEMKLALSQMIRNYEMAPSVKSGEPLKLDPKAFILAPLNGIWLKLTARTSNVCN